MKVFRLKSQLSYGGEAYARSALGILVTRWKGKVLLDNDNDGCH